MTSGPLNSATVNDSPLIGSVSALSRLLRIAASTCVVMSGAVCAAVSCTISRLTSWSTRICSLSVASIRMLSPLSLLRSSPLGLEPLSGS
jgi:hypothetical protein